MIFAETYALLASPPAAFLLGEGVGPENTVRLYINFLIL